MSFDNIIEFSCPGANITIIHIPIPPSPAKTDQSILYCCVCNLTNTPMRVKSSYISEEGKLEDTECRRLVRDKDSDAKFTECGENCVLGPVEVKIDRQTRQPVMICDAAFPNFPISKEQGEAPDAYKFVLEVEGKAAHEVYVVCSTAKMPRGPVYRNYSSVHDSQQKRPTIRLRGLVESNPYKIDFDHV